MSLILFYIIVSWVSFLAMVVMLTRQLARLEKNPGIISENTKTHSLSDFVMNFLLGKGISLAGTTKRAVAPKGKVFLRFIFLFLWRVYKWINIKYLQLINFIKGKRVIEKKGAISLYLKNISAYKDGIDSKASIDEDLS